MAAIGADMSWYNATFFVFCTIRLVERIGIAVVVHLMLTQHGLVHRVFAIGDQAMPNAMETASKWITFIYEMTIYREAFPTSLVNSLH